MGDAPPDRRQFLKVATCAVGGGLGLAAVAPIARLVVDPAGKQTVITPTEPIDIGAIESFAVGAEPRKVDIIAPRVTDAWSAARDVLVGAAWLRRTAPDKVAALSAVCPHLGCSIGWDPSGKTFLCPCHDSRFSPAGAVLGGPSLRAMDELPIAIVDGRLRLTWQRYAFDTTEKKVVG